MSAECSINAPCRATAAVETPTPTIDRILELDKEQEEANERREKEAEQR